MTDYEKYYQTSIEVLTKIIKEQKKVPTEKSWNRLAGNGGYLTSQSLGFISQTKFSELCKNIYKEIQNKKEKNKWTYGMILKKAEYKEMILFQ